MSDPIADAARTFIALRRAKLVRKAERARAKDHEYSHLDYTFHQLQKQTQHALEQLEHVVNRETSESQLQDAVDKEPQ